MIKGGLNMDEIKNNEVEQEPVIEMPVEVIPTARIRLDEYGRCIAMDCTFLDSDTVIEKEQSELPLPYSEFARVLDQYVYRNNTFIHEPYEQPQDPVQKLIEEQERQGKALEEIISMLLGE